MNTFFFRANLDMDLTDTVRLRGNAGVQYIRTDQQSTGFNAADNAIVGSQTLGTSYGDILPSLNLVADFGDGWMVRFGAAKTLMRPPINYLSADSSAFVDDQGASGPAAAATRCWSPIAPRACDLSLEKYFGEGSYVGLAVFYKDLETYVYQQNYPVGLQRLRSTTATDPGFELRQLQHLGQRHRRLHARRGTRRAHSSASCSIRRWTGFGTQLNASYTESSIDPDPGDASPGTDTIPGLSKIVANATLYYEKHGFSARVSQRYRDAYRGEYSALFGQRQYPLHPERAHDSTCS